MEEDIKDANIFGINDYINSDNVLVPDAYNEIDPSIAPPSEYTNINEKLFGKSKKSKKFNDTKSDIDASKDSSSNNSDESSQSDNGESADSDNSNDTSSSNNDSNDASGTDNSDSKDNSNSDDSDDSDDSDSDDSDNEESSSIHILGKLNTEKLSKNKLVKNISKQESNKKAKAENLENLLAEIEKYKTLLKNNDTIVPNYKRSKVKKDKEYAFSVLEMLKNTKSDNSAVASLEGALIMGINLITSVIGKDRKFMGHKLDLTGYSDAVFRDMPEIHEDNLAMVGSIRKKVGRGFSSVFVYFRVFIVNLIFTIMKNNNKSKENYLMETGFRDMGEPDEDEFSDSDEDSTSESSDYDD